MNSNNKSLSRTAMFVIALDLVSLAVFYLLIPSIRRPFDVFLPLLIVLSVLTAVVVKSDAFRSVMMVIASLAAGMFGLEMADKFLGITDLASSASVVSMRGEGSPYTWAHGRRSYFDAREKARLDGVDPEALEYRNAEDIFADADPSTLTRSTYRNKDAHIETVKRTTPGNRVGSPEHEPLPNTKVRQYSQEAIPGQYYTNAVYTLDSHGLRWTRGRPDAAEAVLFLGDSFTFGAFLNDDETTPYHFNKVFNFNDNVINAGIVGWGPHQVLRDLELNERIGPAIAGSGRVSRVYYGLIDEHINRCTRTAPRYPDEPHYTLDAGGELVRHSSWPKVGRLSLMLSKSRIYPVLRERLDGRYENRSGADYKWRLTVALLVEADRISRERYGVPLTVVYWDDNPKAFELIGDAGLELIHVDDAFPDGGEWRRMAIKYLLFDSHPNAYANKKLGEYLAKLKRGE